MQLSVANIADVPAIHYNITLLGRFPSGKAWLGLFLNSASGMVTQMPEFFITTLGCKVNQYESQALAEAWQSLGWQERYSSGEVASGGVLLVNSCAVTASAVADVRATVRRLHRENPFAQIWIVGCSAQTHRLEMKALPGVQAVIPTARKPELLKYPEQWLRGEQKSEELAAPDGERIYPPFSISTYRRARPVLKIQDGCSHGCTYCIVPLARGAAVSRPPDEVLAEARRLLEAGFREIILSGINLSQYRLPSATQSGERKGFWSLLEHLELELASEWKGTARLRISSLEPGQLNEQALDILARSQLVCPHLHISLQSGSNSILKRMGRGHYQPDLLPEFCKKLKNIWPRFGLGVDLLVGFPGENDSEFQETLQLVDSLPLTYAHVFPYSRRPGTVAATMPGQLAKSVLSNRSAVLRQTVQEKKGRFLDELASEHAELRVVLENSVEGAGISEYYTECKFISIPEMAGPKVITRTHVLGREQERLLVEPVQEQHNMFG